MKDKEIEQYYEDYFEMFATKGWKQLIKDSEEVMSGFRIEGIEDEKALKNIQGQIQILNNLINLEHTMRQAFDNIEEEEKVG